MYHNTQNNISIEYKPCNWTKTNAPVENIKGFFKFIEKRKHESRIAKMIKTLCFKYIFNRGKTLTITPIYGITNKTRWCCQVRPPAISITTINIPN